MVGIPAFSFPPTVSVLFLCFPSPPSPPAPPPAEWERGDSLQSVVQCLGKRAHITDQSPLYRLRAEGQGVGAVLRRDASG